jgi:hypothetical protein
MDAYILQDLRSMEKTSGWTRGRTRPGMSKGMVEQGEAKLRGWNGGGTLKRPQVREHRCSTMFNGPDDCLNGTRAFGTRSLCDNIQGTVKKFPASVRFVIMIRYASDTASQNRGETDKLGSTHASLLYLKSSQD